MNKYKFILNGKGEQFTTKSKGDLNYIVSGIMQYVCEKSIDNNMSKKEFVDNCKKTYEIIERLRGEENE